MIVTFWRKWCKPNSETFSPSRLIWKVVERDRDKIEQKVEQALNDAKTTLQKNLEKERD